MIGKKYSIKGTEFEIIEDRGDAWGVRSDSDPDIEAIDKQLLREALSRGEAVETSI